MFRLLDESNQSPNLDDVYLLRNQIPLKNIRKQSRLYLFSIFLAMCGLLLQIGLAQYLYSRFLPPSIVLLAAQ